MMSELTFPVPGGPYRRTPDRLRNPDENNSLCKRGNYMYSRDKQYEKDTKESTHYQVAAPVIMHSPSLQFKRKAQDILIADLLNVINMFVHSSNLITLSHKQTLKI